MEHFFQKIDGWFTYPKLYAEMAKTFDNAIFVEVGTWKGRSASYMVVEIINNKKNIKFYCVDTWQGSVEHTNFQEIKDGTLFDVFISNMKEVEGKYIPMRMTSEEASRQFKDESIDFIFIDASHEYGDVKNDIKCWLPKVKKGGVIAGHDYDLPEVQKAVQEVFADIKDEECCWITKKYE